MDKTVVILAAGMGSRYGGLKQLDQVGPSGECILDYSVYDALRAGFNKVVIIIRRDIEESFKRQMGDRFAGRVKVEYVFQELTDIPKEFVVPKHRAKPWGTGHAMLAAAPAVSDPFIIINADDFYGFPAFAGVAEYLNGINQGELKAALVGFLLENTLSRFGSVARGICGVDRRGNLGHVEEVLGIYRNNRGELVSDNRRGLRARDVVSMNMWAFSPAIFDYVLSCFKGFLQENLNDPKGEFYIPLVVNSLIQGGTLGVKVLETDSQWHGITYREDRAEMEAIIVRYVSEGLYPNNLWGD